MSFNDKDHGAARREDAEPVRADEAATQNEAATGKDEGDGLPQVAPSIQRLLGLLETDAAWGLIVLVVIGAAVVFAG